MRLAVYTDYVYRLRDGAVFGERAFVLFLAALAEEVDELTVIGRLDPGSGPAQYRLPDDVRFVALPHYPSLAAGFAVVRVLPRTLARAWRALDAADGIWTLGPYPYAIALALFGLVRRKRTVLGVRQDFPGYVRNRRPGRRSLHAAAQVLERCWLILARRCPVIVVGSELAGRYRRAPRLLELTVSLVDAADIEAGASAAARRDYGRDLRILTVGRLDPEKNPLLLADVLARLRSADGRWRMTVCGEGDLGAALARRLRELGLDRYVELRGYVALDRGLLELYRRSHAFLHVSRTEAVPQVLFEAMASGLPVVATDVGGVRQAVGDAALLIPAGDAAAAAAALTQLAADAALRKRLIDAGLASARTVTRRSEVSRVARFIAG
jgi:glycosyltransferase involved in cell wall biosynthesis